MENKLGRKSMAEWLETMQGVMGNLYNDAFQAGYDAAKDETPDVETMAEELFDKYTGDDLDEMLRLLEGHVLHGQYQVDNQPELKTVKRVAEVGERILITNAGISGNYYKNGDILKVRGFDFDNDILAEGFDLQIEHDEYEVIIDNENPVPIKSPNQQRAELIQRAREFVGRGIYRRRQLCGLSGDQISFRHRFCKLEFVVNEEKRTVVALIKSLHGKKIYKGIAKCMPDEVFNADIGKAIALARALEIEIPQEFIHAIQPDKKVLGMIVGKVVHRDVDEGYTSVVSKPGKYRRGGRRSAINSDFVRLSTIIDDTNAQYEVTP